MPDIRRELEGVRILEYGPFANAALAGKMMADLGATVVKIESPDGDEPGRAYGPFPGDIPNHETSGFHLYYNANKLGVTLRPGLPTGRSIFQALAAWADVLIDGTQPGELDALSLDYPQLKDACPRLVMVALSSLGRSGPYGRYRGYDLTSWHGSGSAHAYAGDPHREPLWAQWNHASFWGGVNAACAAMLALHARQLTGRGQYVDLSEAETLATLHLAVEVSGFYQDKAFRVRTGTGGMENQAPAGMRKTRDGWACVVALAPHQWEALVQAMGNPDWAQSPLFKGTSRQRAPYSAEIYHLMTGWLESHTSQEIFAVCRAHGVPAAPVNTVQDLYHDGHLAARGYFVEIDHPAAGRLRVPGPPLRFSGDPWRIDRPAPLLGQHNEAVYGGVLGIPRAELADLRRAGVI